MAVVLDPQKDKFTINQILNSPVKRAIIGLYFKLVKEFVQNTLWNPEVYNKLSVRFGKQKKEEKVTQKQLQAVLGEDQANETIELLVDLRLLLPLPLPKPSDEVLFGSVEEFVASSEEFFLASGVDFDSDRFATPSGGLSLSLGTIHHLLSYVFQVKVAQPKLQTTLEELNAIPSRQNLNEMVFLLSPVSGQAKSQAKKKLLYKLNDPVYEFLNQYHPLPSATDDSFTGQVFLELVETSLRMNKFVGKTLLTEKRAKDYLKLLDKSVLLKNMTQLVDQIICRELIISSTVVLLEDHDRFPFFQQKLDQLSNEGRLGNLVVKEAEMTTRALPGAFEYLDPYDQPVGVVFDWLTTFSRLYVALVISRVVSSAFNDDESVFRPRVGDVVFVELHKWLQKPGNRRLMNILDDLVTEASFLVEFYTQEEVEQVAKDFRAEM